MSELPPHPEPVTKPTEIWFPAQLPHSSSHCVSFSSSSRVELSHVAAEMSPSRPVNHQAVYPTNSTEIAFAPAVGAARMWSGDVRRHPDQLPRLSSRNNQRWTANFHWNHLPFHPLHPCHRNFSSWGSSMGLRMATARGHHEELRDWSDNPLPEL